MSRPTNSLALVSVISGVLGWVGVPIFASIVAVICGHLARSQIRRSREDGDVLAVVGLVLGYTHLLVACLATAFVVLVYGGLFAFLAAAGIAGAAGG